MDGTLPDSPIPAVTSPLVYVKQLTGAEFISVFFTIIFILWAIYTLVSVYHWVRYGRSSWVAVPAIGVHLIVSAFLMVYAVAGFK